MPILFSELRYSIRALISQPAWTFAAVLCLAIGMGVNTASFTLINGVLLRPLPFEDPHELVMVALRDQAHSQGRPFSLQEFRALEAGADMFQQTAVRAYLPVSLAGGNAAPRMAQAEFVTGNYFEALRVRALVGRMFGAAEDRPGSEIAAVLSERLWRARFRADRSIEGKAIRVNGRVVTVRGVAPAGFAGAMRIIAADIWLPAAAYGSFASPNAPGDVERRPMFGMIARLKPGISPARAREQMDALVRARWSVRNSRGERSTISTAVEEAAGFGVPPAIRRTVIGASALLFGLMGLLIALAVANVASLMLARAAGRHREVAMRLALGAGRARIMRQILIESMALAFAGACLGGMAAWWLPHLLTGLGPRLPDHLSFAVDVRPDWRVMIYAAASAISIAVLFGMAPARQASRTDLVSALKGSGGGGRTRATLRLLNAFVTGQIAVSTVLLVAAGLLVRTYWNTQAVDPGIDVRNALAASVDLNQSGFDAARGRAAYDRILARVSTLAGIESAALTSHAPLSPGGSSVKLFADDASGDKGAGAGHNAGMIVVSPAYFSTLRIPLVHGREFTAGDRGAPAVAIINETLARRLWPNGAAVGRSFRIGGEGGRRLEAIGVAKDAKYRRLSEDPAAVFYEPLAQTYAAEMTMVARTTAGPASMVEQVRDAIQIENRDLAVIDVATLEEQLREAAAPAKQRSLVLVSLCTLGLLLSSFGLYGVVSYSVRQRVREVGVRMALGARGADIAALVLRQALKLVSIGLLIGVAASLAAARILSGVLFGVSARDPLTFGAVAVALAAVAVAASFLPARWAIKVDPMLAMRAE